jgi:DNA-binding IclR family transcriptional regulator
VPRTDEEAGVAGGAAECGRSVTSKVTAILLVFARGGTYSLTELARLTGLPVSTTHRLAGELTARQLLERTEDGEYRVGLPLRRIAAPGASPARAGSAADLLARARWAVADLAAATDAVVRLGVPDGSGVAEAVVRPRHPAPDRFAPCPQPAHATALGRTLLAFGPSGAAERAVGAMRPAEAGARLRRSLRVTRLSRVALVPGPAGSAAVAMPVFGAGGLVAAALQLDVDDVRTGLERARAALTVATGSLSRELAIATATAGAPLDPQAGPTLVTG